MAMHNWKSFLMPYEQAVDELKIKLKSIRKEYMKDQILDKILHINRI